MFEQSEYKLASPTLRLDGRMVFNKACVTLFFSSTAAQPALCVETVQVSNSENELEPAWWRVGRARSVDRAAFPDLFAAKLCFDGEAFSVKLDELDRVCDADEAERQRSRTLVRALIVGGRLRFSMREGDRRVPLFLDVDHQVESVSCG